MGATKNNAVAPQNRISIFIMLLSNIGYLENIAKKRERKEFYVYENQIRL